MIRTIARWLFLGLLIYSPWAYGSTRIWAMQILALGLWTCLGLQAVGCLTERRLPSFPVLPSLCLLALLAETVWMYVNARSDHDVFFWEFVPLSPPFPSLPGSWDRDATCFYLQRQLAMAAAFFLAFDVVSRPLWRRKVFLVMALTGVSVALYGLSQRFFNAPSIFWLHEDTGETFFGPYRYHGNAGSFLNLVWPLLLLYVVQAFSSPRAHSARAGWSSALFITLVACGVNVSRGAASITLLLVVLATAWLLLLLREKGYPFSFRKVLLAIAVVLAVAAGLAYSGIATQAETHWSILGQQLEDNFQRGLTYQVCLRLIPSAGWFGYGAGTFSAVFPNHLEFLHGALHGFWKYAHEDYLQTVIEYGYLGTAVWTLFFFGGLFQALRKTADHTFATKDRLRYGVAVLALSAIALHSLADFPLQIASIQFYVTVFLAFAWVRPSRESPRPEYPDAGRS